MERLGTACLLIAALALGACQGAGKVPPKPTGPELSVYDDPLHRSILREQAISLLEQATRSPDPSTRANALEGLLLAPSRAAPLLQNALADENVGVRTVAVMGIGRLRQAESRDAVSDLANDPSPYVRAATIYALTRLGGRPNPSPLARMLLEDSSLSVRSHAAVILGELGDRTSIPMLHEAAIARVPFASSSEVAVMRLQVAEALVKLGETQQLETLNAALFPAQPDDMEAAVLAVSILGELRARDSKELLRNLAIQPRSTGNGRTQAAMPPEFRLAVAASVAQMGDRTGRFIADENRHSPSDLIRAQVAFVYGHVGDALSLHELEAMLADESDVVRVHAATGIIRQLSGGPG